MPVSGRTMIAGQVAIVTGASRGIGRAVAEAFAREGARLVLADVLPTDDVSGAVQRGGAKAVCVRCDVTRTDDVEAMVRAAHEGFGRIDILVTCAGIYGAGDLTTVSLPDWDKVIDVNLKGTYNCVQQVFPRMAEQGYGKIVCVGSLAGENGGVLSGPHYSASKGGVHALVKWLAKYGASRGVYANAVAPGSVETEMLKGQPYSAEYCPLKRFGQPEDIAEPILFLASNASNYITGTVLDVNGGALMA